MDKVPPKRKHIKNATKDELQKLSKDELIDRVLQLEAHNNQLKNIISKQQCSSDVLPKEKQKSFNFAKYHTRRVLLNVMYFGWDYQGLAVQEDSPQTIEHHLFHALVKSCLIESRETSQYHRCGRTDKGVSSFGQVISITLRSKHAPDQQNTPESIKTEVAYCKILNRLLPKDIRAIAWIPIPLEKADYSARFDCKQRQYRYYFPRANLNLDAMRNACTHIIGSHDFRNLCKMDVGNGVTEFIRNVHRAEIVCVDESDSCKPTSMYYLVIRGNAFLWHQIRCIFGVLLLIGMGRESPEVMKELLDVNANPRKPQYDMALDLPLNLYNCTYDLGDGVDWVFERDELRTVITQLQAFWTLHNIKSTMIKDCLANLEDKYRNLSESETEDMASEVCEREVISHANCLLQGVQCKIYKPLLKREKCSSLEEKIEYYKKKRKLDDKEIPQAEV